MSPTLKRILFATDLSVNSGYALEHAAAMASATGARLNLLHVVEPMSDEARITIQMFVQDEKDRRAALVSRTEYAKVILKERMKQFWDSFPDGEAGKIQAQLDTSEVLEGHPAEMILRKAKDLDCDLIVLGAHNHGVTQTFLGSVAKRVLRRARIPTLVVPYIPTRER